MCELIRQYQPNATIVVGGHIANVPNLIEQIDADHVVRGKNPNNVKIGFGRPGNPNARVALIDDLVLGPKYGNTNDIVDLAMLNVHIANWSGPGGLRNSFPFDPANFKRLKAVLR